MSKPNTQKVKTYVQRVHSMTVINKVSLSSLNTLLYQVHMFLITVANQVPPSEQVTAHSRM
jgi:hypothetical protein